MTSSPRIFVTGVSGYVGGHTVVRLIEKHPEWNFVALVRNEEQNAIIRARWPMIETVIGDLGNKKLMILEGSKADVVLQTASADHIPGVQALIKGLSQRQPTPGYFIHVAGTGMLNEVPNGFGQPSTKVYSDITDLKEITSFPLENHVHRDVDMAILKAQKKFSVPTAIVSPPMIHGVGRGPLKTRSIQIPFLIESTLKRGKGFQILEGQNIWDQTNIDDIASAFILLVEEAVKPNGGKADWGQNGYYFVAGAQFKWSDVSEAVAKIAFSQGLIPTAQVDKLSVADASALHPWAPLIWGGNCRSRSDRIEKLGWKANGPNFQDSLSAMIAAEFKTLGTQSLKTTFNK
ncbi:related to nucleoside-diphosphate-sugar epimerase [Rhynchosporium graminicola]|uniref:Related to nucleoside-diphosphate-sugar epimerase n=1 Tax=Rhynchosporium graminicola TaxID=2792576 RepID=A0A1E1LF68_9HELO|nr:related to nucleoside-diphosphate-sugar epimerase [Rhynchosporium commune]